MRRATSHAAPIPIAASPIASSVWFVDRPQTATNGSSSTAGSGAS